MSNVIFEKIRENNLGSDERSKHELENTSRREEKTFGTGSRFGMIHNEFGLEAADPNIDASTHGQKVTFEYIMEQDADYIFVMDRAVIAGGETSAMKVMDNELVRSTRAYKDDNIIYLDPFTWYVSSGGLTGTQNMIDEIYEGLSD